MTTRDEAIKATAERLAGAFAFSVQFDSLILKPDIAAIESALRDFADAIAEDTLNRKITAAPDMSLIFGPRPPYSGVG